MMLKTCGAVLIMAGCIGYTCSQIHRMKKRIELRRELLKMLQLLGGEIRHRKLNLPECFHSIAARLSQPVSVFLTELTAELIRRDGAQLKKIWKQKAKLYFEPELHQELFRFGEEFGFRDADMQLTAIERYQNDLEEKIAMMVKQVQETERIYKILGVLGGAFIVVVLI